jgi:hypothetical protein
MNSTADPQNTFALLLANHQHVHENIKFADQKAGFFVTLDGALCAFVYSLAKPPDTTLCSLSLILCFVLAVGIGLGIFVVWPRGSTNRKRGPGVVDADRAYQFGSEREFVGRCASITDEELLTETRTFLYDRSKINRLKYRYLRLAISVSAVGWFGSLVLAAWAKLYS